MKWVKWLLSFISFRIYLLLVAVGFFSISVHIFNNNTNNRFTYFFVYIILAFFGIALAATAFVVPSREVLDEFLLEVKGRSKELSRWPAEYVKKWWEQKPK